MNLLNTSEPEIRELGGEPLKESGFENDTPSTAFEPYERLAKDGLSE